MPPNEPIQRDGLTRTQRLVLARAAKKAKRETNIAASAVSEAVVVRDSGSDAARELLPRILADEVAWRSAQLALVGDLRARLLEEIRRKGFDRKRTSMPQLIAEIRKLMEFEERTIKETRSLDLNPRTQVAGLIARHALLRQQLVKQGLMDAETGELKMPKTTTSSGRKPAEPDDPPNPKQDKGS